MERIPRQLYTQEFKDEAVSLVENGGLTVADVSRRLSVSQQALRNWAKKYRQDGQISDGRAVTDIEAENSRLRKELAEVEQIEVGINRRRQMKIRCKQVKKYKATTDSNHKLPVAPNLLDQDFSVSGPNKAWVAYITYVSTDEGWLFRPGSRTFGIVRSLATP